MDHLTPAQRQEISEHGAQASAKSSRQKRIAFWIACGVPYEIGLKIYMQGYRCAYQERRRKEQRLLRAPTTRESIESLTYAATTQAKWGLCGACRFWLPHIRDERWEGDGDCTNENLRGRIIGFDHTFGCVAFLPGRIADAQWRTK